MFTMALFIVGCSSPTKNWQRVYSQSEIKINRSYELNEVLTTVVGSPMIKTSYMKGQNYYKVTDDAVTAWRGHPLSTVKGTTVKWQPTFVYPHPDGDYVLTAQAYYQHAIGIIVNEDGSVPENPVMRIDNKGSEERYPITPYKQDLFKIDFYPDRGTDVQNYELIYSGKSGSTINIVYREYVGNMIKDGFKQDLTYDLNESNIIQFKTTKIEVIKGTNTTITFKVIENGK